MDSGFMYILRGLLVIGGFYLMYKLLKSVGQSQPNTAKVKVYSKYVPLLYTNQLIQLNQALRLEFRNNLFKFPTNSLIVTKFKYFKVKDKEFEEVVLSNHYSSSEYRLMFDPLENKFYFLYKFSTHSFAHNTEDQLFGNEKSVMADGENQYEYQDFSDLIETKVEQETHSPITRVIRMYRRPIRSDVNEYYILMMDKPGVVDTYLGYSISLDQLEEVL